MTKKVCFYICNFFIVFLLPLTNVKSQIDQLKGDSLGKNN